MIGVTFNDCTSMYRVLANNWGQESFTECWTAEFESAAEIACALKHTYENVRVDKVIHKASSVKER